MQADCTDVRRKRSVDELLDLRSHRSRREADGRGRTYTVSDHFTVDDDEAQTATHAQSMSYVRVHYVLAFS